MYLLGYDIGTSSIKAALIDSQSGQTIAKAASPSDTELPIDSPRPGWAEQNPQTWWTHTINATQTILKASAVSPKDIKAIGISYQMHGLICIDKNLAPIRPAIIWCDSRAVDTGKKIAEKLSPSLCLDRLLNLPGNFTASKLKWVKDNQPEIFAKTYKFLLPGDYIAMKMTSIPATTPSGLSEAALWDFKNSQPAYFLLDSISIHRSLIPQLIPTFDIQGTLTAQAASQLGLTPETPITYRAGDQPNNAFSLNVLHPGQAAATAGTSGVIYAVSDSNSNDPLSRVNIFLHVNHTPQNIRNGILLCINGTGILNRWLKQNFANTDYQTMNSIAAKTPPGADGIQIFPFGNGAERILQNKNIACSITNINFNRHTLSHILRAAQEGIVFAMNYGLEIIKNIGPDITAVRAGNANMFLSPLFAEIFTAVTQTALDLYDTDGAAGAARAAGIGADIYKNFDEAFANLKKIKTLDPNPELIKTYTDIYQNWKQKLNHLITDNQQK